jgi:hypothetical protein
MAVPPSAGAALDEGRPGGGSGGEASRREAQGEERWEAGYLEVAPDFFDESDFDESDLVLDDPFDDGDDESDFVSVDFDSPPDEPASVFSRFAPFDALRLSFL